MLEEYSDLQGALKRIAELKKFARKGSHKTIIEGFFPLGGRDGLAEGVFEPDQDVSCPIETRTTTSEGDSQKKSF